MPLFVLQSLRLLTFYFRSRDSASFEMKMARNNVTMSTFEVLSSQLLENKLRDVSGVAMKNQAPVLIEKAAVNIILISLLKNCTNWPFGRSSIEPYCGTLLDLQFNSFHPTSVALIQAVVNLERSRRKYSKI